MESTEIDIKMWMSFGGRALGSAGKKKRKKREKQAQGDAHSSSQRECLSKQRFPLGWVPAEYWRSASASYIKYNESRIMMMVLRTKDTDNDGHLEIPINTSTLEWIVLSSVLLVKIHSSCPQLTSECYYDTEPPPLIQPQVPRRSRAQHMSILSLHL